MSEPAIRDLDPSEIAAVSGGKTSSLISKVVMTVIAIVKKSQAPLDIGSGRNLSDGTPARWDDGSE